jgi:aminoglycoside 3-N-acetyltransferase
VDTGDLGSLYKEDVVSAIPGIGERAQTRVSLAADIRRLGILPGETVLVHSSLRSLGWVCGGATAVVQALLDVLTAEGTLVVPAQTANNRDPSTWNDPPLPQSLWPLIRQHFPGFDPQLTPSYRVGVIAERVRTWPGAQRSDHPQTSFAALGPHARLVLADHQMDSQLGESSPLARLEELDARVVLLGVGFERCTAFHLAEYRQRDPPVRTNSCAVMTPGGRHWVTYVSVALHDGDFGELGRDYEREAGVVIDGTVGEARCRLFPIRSAISFAELWFGSHRTTAGSG